jgi:hypothetical protein
MKRGAIIKVYRSGVDLERLTKIPDNIISPISRCMMDEGHVVIILRVMVCPFFDQEFGHVQFTIHFAWHAVKYCDEKRGYGSITTPEVTEHHIDHGDIALQTGCRQGLSVARIDSPLQQDNHDIETIAFRGYLKKIAVTQKSFNLAHMSLSNSVTQGAHVEYVKSTHNKTRLVDDVT